MGQVWRGGHGRQANLPRLMAGIDVRLPRRQARLSGRSPAGPGWWGGRHRRRGRPTRHDGDEILTSDPDDLREPSQVAGKHVELIPL